MIVREENATLLHHFAVFNHLLEIVWNRIVIEMIVSICLFVHLNRVFFLFLTISNMYIFSTSEAMALWCSTNVLLLLLLKIIIIIILFFFVYYYY